MHCEVTRPFNRALLIAVFALAAGSLLGYWLETSRVARQERRIIEWTQAHCTCVDRSMDL